MCVKPARTYDQFAARYDRGMASLERWFLGRWREEAFSHLPSDSTILEVGAGTGLNFRFYPAGSRITASEISFPMLEFAREKIERENVTLVQADAETLPFPDGYFDAAVATLVFCSINSPHNAFAEIRRVAKPGGRIVLLEHVRPHGLLGYLFDLFSLVTVRLFEDHFNRRTSQTAIESGLNIKQVIVKAFGIVNLIICENNK